MHSARFAVVLKTVSLGSHGGTGTINTIYDSVTNTGTAQSFSIPDDICVNVFTKHQPENT